MVTHHSILVSGGIPVARSWWPIAQDNCGGLTFMSFTIWLTGLPGSGKTTIATALGDFLHQNELTYEILDGDILRKTLCSDLGYSPEDRQKNAIRVAYVCQILNKNKIISVVSLITPYNQSRKKVKSIVPNLVEVYVFCPIEVLIKRDPKGLYRKALEGEIKDFTGISAPYEIPESPDVIVQTDRMSVHECVKYIIDAATDKGFLGKIFP
ncbi:MAG: adenylyl-sulfate kinase [Gloeomargarita sp. GMQP_bins_120]